MNYKSYISSSGIKIYLINSNKINTVHITIHIPIGASSENDDEHGIAHYLEHMLFTNTKKYKEEEINNLIDFYGADINAETQYDKTLFYINGNPEYTLELFDIIHEIYFNGITTIEKFEREKNIIIQELENDFLTPGIKSDKLAHKLMFNDRYRKLVGGEIDDIHKITFDKLNKFKQKYYTPENTTIIFFGKFDNNQVLNEIKRKLGELTDYIQKFNPMIQNLIEFKNNEKTIIKYIKTDNKQVTVNFYFKTINITNIWNYKIKILINILTNSLSALLTKKLRIEKGLIYGIDSTLYTFRNVGFFNISFNCQNKNTNQCIKEVLKILCKLQKYYINKLFIIKSVNRTKTTLLNYSNSSLFELNNILKSLTFNINPLSLDEIFDIIKNISVKDINYICTTLFHPNNTIIIIEGDVIDKKLFN
jgi:predicted Zn-dependent peptidase